MSGPSGGGTVPLLHVITDDAVVGRADFLPVAEEVLLAGGAGVALHLRGPVTPAATLVRLAEGLLPLACDAGGWLVVNDRADVALVSGCPRVQLGTRSLPPHSARAILGQGAGIGVSVHDAAEAGAAAAAGADWVVVGTIYETPSHPQRAGAGAGLVEDAVAVGSGVPVIAIGGVTPERIGELRRAGAHGVAVIRGIWAHRDPAGAVREYLQELNATTKEGP